MIALVLLRKSLMEIPSFTSILPAPINKYGGLTLMHRSQITIGKSDSRPNGETALCSNPPRLVLIDSGANWK